ncbi:PhzF family phenazine biosynthesis protein [Sorangium sp. So ce216]
MTPAPRTTDLVNLQHTHAGQPAWAWTAQHDRDFDFVSRFFAPATGVNEDPVTGSAHCGLTPFWAARLGKAEMLACQASARGGVVRVRVRGDRVDLGGQAVTILEGELRAEPNIRGEGSPPSDSPPVR